MNRHGTGPPRRAPSRSGVAAVRTVALALASCAAGFGCEPEPSRAQGSGDPKRGEQLARTYGCGNCHVVPGLARARSTVGPPLSELGRRTYAGGRLNTPANLAAFLQDPQAFDPQNPMPRLGIGSEDARDLVAYLHQLR